MISLTYFKYIALYLFVLCGILLSPFNSISQINPDHNRLELPLPSAELRGGGGTVLKINEIMCLNNNGLQDEFGEYEDWIEIYNAGDDGVEIDDYYISDDPFDPFKWSLEALDETILQAGSYLVLFADDQPEQGNTHVGFSLDSNGEYIGLYNEEGILIDGYSFGTQALNTSYGYVDNGEDLNHFSNPSPGAANPESGLLGILSSPGFNVSDGFFSIAQNIGITHEDEFAEIRYTTDGTEPNPLSSLYEAPVSVEPGNVLRSRAFRPGYMDSKVASVSVLAEEDYAANAVVLVADPDALLGDDGIYENPYSGLERKLEFSYLVNEEVVLKQFAGVQIHAPDTRSQKSLRLYARSEYGNNEFAYPFFEEKSIESYTRLILRNGGNDGVELNHTGLRDPLITSLYGSIEEGYGYSAWEPVHVFINGEYWGLYSLRERQDEDFISQNYGYAPEEVNYLERSAGAPQTYNAITGNWNDFNEMEATAIELDLSDDDNYAIMEAWMNISNFVDYQTTEIYICNQDWLSNNMKFWRTYTPDRKWEWIIWDTDWGLGTFYPNYIHGSPDWNSLNFALSNWGGWTTEVETELLQNLVENEGFRNYFSTRAADLTNSYLRDTRIQERLTQMSERVEPDMPFQFERWGSSMGVWQNDLNIMHNFVAERQGYLLQHFSERFELGERFTIELDTEPEGAGYIEVNTIYTDELPWNGLYYEGLPVELRAVANPGYTFSSWQGLGISDSELSVNLENDSSLTALFEVELIAAAPVINEIHYNPSEDWSCGEWIELYNPGTLPVNLSGWTLGDAEGNSLAFGNGLEMDPESFVIISMDTLSFQSHFPGVDHLPLQFDASLSNNGGTIFLINSEQTVEDYVNYGIVSPWPGAPNGGGPSLELISPELNNNIGSNWFARTEAGGSPGEVNDYTILTAEQDCIEKAYPNPFHSEFRLLSSCGFSGFERCELYNPIGQLVLEIPISGSVPYIDLHLSDEAPNGMYFYRLVGSSVKSGTMVKSP